MDSLASWLVETIQAGSFPSLRFDEFIDLQAARAYSPHLCGILGLTPSVFSFIVHHHDMKSPTHLSYFDLLIYSTCASSSAYFMNAEAILIVSPFFLTYFVLSSLRGYLYTCRGIFSFRALHFFRGSSQDTIYDDRFMPSRFAPLEIQVALFTRTGVFLQLQMTENHNLRVKSY